MKNEANAMRKDYRLYGEFGSINPLQALHDLGCFRLASRISDLRKQGYPIISERVNYNTRLGEAKHFNEYRLMEE